MFHQLAPPVSPLLCSCFTSKTLQGPMGQVTFCAMPVVSSNSSPNYVLTLSDFCLNALVLSLRLMRTAFDLEMYTYISMSACHVQLPD